MKRGVLLFYFAIAFTVLFSPLTGKSLWKDDAESFLDKKEFSVGDSIRIIFNYNADLSLSSTANGGNSMDTSKPSLSTIVEFLPEVSLGNSKTHNASSETSLESEATGSVMAEVINILENGYLQVEGGHLISVNGEKEEVRIEGKVNPKTIKNESVLSSDIINASITYSGISTGIPERFNINDIVSVTNIDYTTNISLSNAVITNVETLEEGVITNIIQTNYPLTNISTKTNVSVEISEIKKQQIILEYLNKVLDTLFRY